MKRRKLENFISYRVSQEQRQLFAEVAGDEASVNDWCREAALEKLKKLREAGEKNTPAETGNGTGQVADVGALLEEIARLGYLIEHGFGIHLAGDKPAYKEWMRRVKDSKDGGSLAELALERGSSGAGIG
jgi:hypothetical protein